MTSKDAIFHLSPHLLYPDNHFALTSNDLLHAVEELEEEFLASEDEAGSMSLADEDAALAETERTCPAGAWGTKGHEAHPCTRTYDACAPGGSARRFRGEEEANSPPLMKHQKKRKPPSSPPPRTSSCGRNCGI